MASVWPTSDPVSLSANAPSQMAVQSRWSIRGTQILHLWRRMQVSYYGGKYSIQRVLALDEYTRITSISRVILVLVATPLPMAVLVYGQELIPLQDVSGGWSANVGVWIRTAVLVGIVTHGLLVQATYLIDAFVVSTCQMISLYAIMSAGVVALSMSIAAFFIFPIPFFVLLMTVPFYLLLVISSRVVIGSRALDRLLADKTQVRRCVYFVCAQTSTVAIFPTYELLFRAAEGTSYQLPVVLLLPVIKVAVKNVVLHFAKSLEDMIPVEVIFTADFFNAMYVATCMQSASSVVTVTAITVTDLSQTLIMLYGLQHGTTSILSRLRQHVGNAAESDNIVTDICSLCQNPASLRKLSCAGIRRRSCLPHQLSDVNKSVLDSLNGILDDNDVLPEVRRPTAPPRIAEGPRPQNTVVQDLPSTSSCFRPRPKFTKTIIPMSLDPVKRRCMDGALPRERTILLESLETLFTTECLALSAYLEAFMPLFYCSFMRIMVHLHNAQYHTEMKGVTRANVDATILPLFVFGLLQIASFALLVWLIKRNCGMRALYQLAFVLESQRSLIQCKMMLWMVITLCFRVVHFGVDFKLEFIRLGFPKTWIPKA